MVRKDGKKKASLMRRDWDIYLDISMWEGLSLLRLSQSGGCCLVLRIVDGGWGLGTVRGKDATGKGK